MQTLTQTCSPIPHASNKNPPEALHKIAAGLLTTKTDWKSPVGSSAVRCIHNCLKKRLDMETVSATDFCQYAKFIDSTLISHQTKDVDIHLMSAMNQRGDSI